MAKNEVILRFDKVSFEYGVNKPILDVVSFPLRVGSKITIMGQNGSGKTTIFKMITGELTPQKGKINIVSGNTIAVARQVIPRNQLHLSIKEFFETESPESLAAYNDFLKRHHDFVVNALA